MNPRRSTSRVRAGAFTLVEMLVVVTIIIITVIAILPAFSRIIDSNNYASAVNAVSATLSRVGSRGVEGGVVFLFDPRTQRMTLVQVELHDPAASLRSGPSGRVPAIAFRPVPGFRPVELPAGFGVYGLSFLHDDIGASLFPTPPQADDAWYPNEAVWEDDPNTGARRLRYNPWLLPRNDFSFFGYDYVPADFGDPNHPVNQLPPEDLQFPPGFNYDYDPDPDNLFRYAQTFFIWFGADGSLRTAASMPPGVRDCYLEHPDLPFDPALDPADPDYHKDLDDRFDPQTYFDGAGSSWAVLNPEVRMRPVEQIAIVDFRLMREGTGVANPWWWRAQSVEHPPYLDSAKMAFEYDPQSIPLDTGGLQPFRRVQDWIDANAEIIGFNRYSGQALRR